MEVRRLCQDLNSIEVGEPDSRLTSTAAYCVGDRFGRGAVGAMPRPDSMNKEFRRFLDRMLFDIFFLFPLHFLGE